MKKWLFILFGAMLLAGSTPMCAETYYLYCCDIGQKGNHGSKMPLHPLSIDFTNHVLTIPYSIIGYTLVIMGEDGELYTSTLSANTKVLPEDFEGEFVLQITNGKTTYVGKVCIHDVAR